MATTALRKQSFLLKKRLKEKLRQSYCHETARVSKGPNGDTGENETFPVYRCFQTEQRCKKKMSPTIFKEKNNSG